MDNINTNNFDFLRVIFAFTIAISHFIGLSGITALQHYSSFFNTRLAIDGFFIISGFLIAKSFNKSTSLKDYFKRRIKRIIPAYIFIILACALLFSFISSKSFSNYFLSVQFWKYLGANLTFQNYIEPSLPGVFENNKISAVNGALWTIKVEEAFYILLPIFFWLINKRKLNFYILSVSVYILSIAYFNYFMNIDLYRFAKQLPGALSFFMMGIVLYKNYLFFIKWKHHIIIPCVIFFLIEHFIIKSHFLKPATFGFIVFYIAYNFKYLNNFGRYGDFTYGIYIYHCPIIQTLFYFGFYNKFSLALTGTTTLFLVLLFAISSWYFIELPYLPKTRRTRFNLMKKKT